MTTARIVRELTMSSRSKFKMVWHQFSTVQFPIHQFVGKVRSVQFGTRRPSTSVQFVHFRSFSSVHELFRPWLGLTWLARFGSTSVQSIESLIAWEKQRSSSRSPPAEIPVRRPGGCRLGGGMRALMTVIGVGTGGQRGQLPLQL